MRKTVEITYVILIALICINCLTGHAQTDISGGNVYGTWTKLSEPFNILGDITIPNDSTLTIEHGVQVVFTGHYKLDVQGTLKAEGLVDDRILFTVGDTTGYYNNADTGWKGIWFDQTLASNDSSYLVFCTIEYGKSDSSSVPNGNPEGSGGGLYIWGFSKIYMYGLEVRYCRAYAIGGGVFITNQNPSANVTLLYSQIHHNSIVGCCWGGGIYAQGDFNLIGSQIWENSSGMGAGIYMESGNNIFIGNSVISDNSAGSYGGGINILQFDRATFENNLICNNTGVNKGGGVYIEMTNTYFLNNTISNNLSTGAGGGIYSEENASYTDTVVNMIVWGNVASTVDSSLAGDISVTYSDIKGGHTGTGNFSSDPLFTLPSAGIGAEYDGITAIWSLLPQSPCINAGKPGLNYTETDLAGFPRVDCVSDTIDMGAFEFVPEDVMPVVDNAIVHISEDAENNSIVHTVTGRNVLYFKILEGNTDNAFSLDSVTGVIRVNNNQVLDHDAKPIYELIIRGYNNCASSENVITIMVDEVTVFSVETTEIENDIIISSNPVKGNLFVQLPENSDFRSWMLITADGKRIEESNITGNSFEVEVAKLKKGVYLLILVSKEGSRVTRKIMVE